MDRIRYVHAADLHLDAAFKGLSRVNPEREQLARHLQASTFSALDKLVALCEKEKPDFLVLAGDIYNAEDRSIAAQRKLRDACAKLERSNVHVFIAHGNHDPLNARLRSIVMPQNVTIFGPEPEKHFFRKEDRLLCMVHGISHSSPKESRNLAKLFSRDPENDCFQLGVLHCCVGNMQAERYAPCALEDLQSVGLDAWALGHVHERQILSAKPFIAYSGNAQGLHINETGSRGCWLVDVCGEPGNWHIQPTFQPLHSIQWEKPVINLEKVKGRAEIADAIAMEVENIRSALPASLAGIIMRLQLVGRTEENNYLRSVQGNMDILGLESEFADRIPPVWFKDILPATGSYESWETALPRQDLLGETARVAQSLISNDQDLTEFINYALQDAQKTALVSIMEPYDLATMREVLLDAVYICQQELRKD